MIKQSILRKHPTFDEGELGFSGFTDFLKQAQKLKRVSLTQDDRSRGYTVDLYEGDPEEDPNLKALSPNATKLRKHLLGLSINPTTHMIRHTVVHEFVDHVSERKARKKINSLRYVYSDIQRRCRKSDPPVSATSVRHVINGLKAAGIDI